MNRHYTVEHYLELIEYARKKVPGITFSSDIHPWASPARPKRIPETP